MARSLIGENQVRDEEFLSEEEHRTEAIHTFDQLSDVTTWSGHAGEYLRATESGTEWATVSGAGGEYDDELVFYHDGSRELTGDMIPSSGTGVISAVNLGSSERVFANIWVEDIHMGPHTLWVDGVPVLSYPGQTVQFAPDYDEHMNIKTTGVGTLNLISDALVNMVSHDEIHTTADGGVEFNVTASGASKHINFQNQSVLGNITFASLGANSQVQFWGEDEIDLTSPFIDINGYDTVDITAPTVDINAYLNMFLDAENLDVRVDEKFDVRADEEIELNAPLIDINGPIDASSTLELQNGTTINEFSTDGTLADNSDDAVPTEQAVKTYVDNGLATISGGGGLTTLIELEDVPSYYEDGKYLKSTASGTEWATVSGGSLDHATLNNLDYVSSEHTGFQPAGDYATNTALTTTSGNLQTGIDLKFDKAGGTITDDVTIQGNLTVTGTEFIAHTEDLYVKDNLIVLNYGETGGGVTKGHAGVEIARGTEDAYQFMFVEATADFRIGVSGTSLQAVATREDSPTNTYVPYWNSAALRFDTAGSMAYTDIASTTVTDALDTKIDTTSGTLQSEIDNLSMNHSELDELDYASAGHTGFASTAALATTSGVLQAGIDINAGDISTLDTKVDTTSGTLQAAITQNASDISDNTILIGTTSGTLQTDIDNHTGDATIHFTEASIDKYTKAEVDTISGSLQAGVDAKPDTFLELDDTPLVYNEGSVLISTASGVGYVTLASGSLNTSLAVVQVERETEVDSGATWADYDFISTVFQNKTETLEHNSSDTTEILIKSNGVYQVTYGLVVEAQDAGGDTTTDTYSRALLNGTLISGSDSGINTYEAERHELGGGAVFNGTTGDVLTVQHYRGADPVKIIHGSAYTIKLDGVKGVDGEDGQDGQDGQDGDPGPSGSGATIVVKDEGSYVDNTPHEQLDFVGDGVTVTSTTSGIATVTISGVGDSGPHTHTFLNLSDTPTSYVDERYVVSTSSGIEYLTPPVFGTEYGYTSSEGESSTTSTAPVEKVSLSATGLPSGDYRIDWNCEYERTDEKDTELNIRVQIDDTTTIAEMYDDNSKKQYLASSGFYEASLSGDVDIDMDYWDSAGAGSTIRRARLGIFRVS